MPQPRAQVTSIEAIDSFRASLLIFLAKARSALDEIDDEKQHTKAWLENDRRNYWEREYRRRSRQLEEAQQELFSAKVSRVRTQTAAQVLAVERAKQALRVAEEKRELIKRWSREFDNRAEPLLKQLEPLHSFLTTDLAKAAVYLANVVKALEAYAAVPTSGGAGPTPASSPVPEPMPGDQHEEPATAPASAALVSPPAQEQLPS